jgi:hypothetical protein
MDSVFKVCKQGTCGISITGLENDNNEYLTDETTVSIRNYTFLQSATINAITSIKSDLTETLDTYGVVTHETGVVDESDFDMSTDGLYKVTHIILPTDTWLTLAISKNGISTYTLIYYYDTTAKVIKKYTSGVSTEVTIDELLEVNASDTTTIIRADKNTFCLCRLNQCFYKLCKALFSSLPSKCYNKLDENKSMIYNRDIIWMAINIIKYLIEQSQYYEAQRILEEVTQCGSICNNIIVDKNSGGGCGCSN